MIEDAVNKSNEGVKVTEEIVKEFKDIVENINKVNNLITEIAAASNEQAQGIEQINVAVNQLDTVTQQNAANAEESASVAEELNSHSQELVNMTNTFILDSNKDTRQNVLTLKRTAATKRTNTKGSNKSKDKLHATVEKKVKRNTTSPNPKTSSEPEDIIPLDDDEMEDFKGF